MPTCPPDPAPRVPATSLLAPIRPVSDAVARYYDRNTSRFLLVGRGRDTHSIHRELWAPGVTSPAEAAGYVDQLVADEIAERKPGGPDVLVDFGCGVGGTLVALARRFPDARLRGVTISPRQVQLAGRLARDAGLQDRLSVALGDFHAVELGVRADAVVAIESLAHSQDVAAFMSNAARHLRPGGVLVVADDFIEGDPRLLTPIRRRWVSQLRAGWRIPGLGSDQQLTEEASGHGLTLRANVDLTPHTRPGSRVRDRLLALTAPMLAASGLAGIPFFGNMIGGNALQVGLREGFIRYRLMVFESGGGDG